MRERTIRWEDPALLPQLAAKSEGGLAFLQSLIDGDAAGPPVMETLGFRLVAVAPGEATFVLTPAEYQFNPLGTVHGGVVATVLDSAMGCAVHTTLPRGVRYTSLDVHVRFAKAVTLASGDLRAIGRVVRGGRSTAIAEARLVDAEETLYAFATSTCLILSGAP